MSVEADTQYFLAKNEGAEGQSLRVFFAPETSALAVPREVLRAQSDEGLATGALWRLITGDMPVTPHEEHSTLEPSSVEVIKGELHRFLRSVPADELFVDDDAPEAIKTVLSEVQESLTQEAKTHFANMFGLVLPSPPEEDDRPYPGMYL